MMTIPINTNYRLKFPVVNMETGKFITGLAIAFSLVKTSDGTVVASGNCSEVGNTGIYYFDYTYTVAQEYDVIITTPIGYYDGFETIMVEDLPALFWSKVIDGIYTADKVLKIMAAVLSGKTVIVDTDNDTAIITFRNLDDTSDVVKATMDKSQRITMTLTP